VKRVAGAGKVSPRMEVPGWRVWSTLTGAACLLIAGGYLNILYLFLSPVSVFSFLFLALLLSLSLFLLRSFLTIFIRAVLNHRAVVD
jgi:hypothetical protein